MTDHDDYLAAAWDEVHANTSNGWYVSKPGYEERHNQRSMHAFDPSETPDVGKRSREWVAAGRPSCAACRRWRGAWRS